MKVTKIALRGKKKPTPMTAKQQLNNAVKTKGFVNRNNKNV